MNPTAVAILKHLDDKKFDGDLIPLNEIIKSTDATDTEVKDILKSLMDRELAWFKAYNNPKENVNVKFKWDYRNLGTKHNSAEGLVDTTVENTIIEGKILAKGETFVAANVSSSLRTPSVN